MTQPEALQNPKVLQALLLHLQDPLSPNEKEWESIKKYAYNPLRTPLKPGGLTPYGHSVARKLALTDILKIGQEHAEKTRVQVHCVLKACQLYTKLHQKGALAPEEENALKKGIALALPNGKTEYMLAVVKGGELLSKPLQRMMEKLFKSLRQTGPEVRRVIQLAAKIHSKKNPQPSPAPNPRSLPGST